MFFLHKCIYPAPLNGSVQIEYLAVADANVIIHFCGTATVLVDLVT